MEAAITLAALPVTSAVLWALLRSSALDRLVALPSGERWHERPTPTFGGVGIALGLLAGIGLGVATGAVEATRELGGIVAGVLILFAAGLLDDARHLSPLAKLAAQLAAAGVAVAAGLRVELVENDVLGTVIALFWLVGITNAFNLLDNMDGLAASLAAVACAYFAIDAATVHENELVLVVSLSLGFACLGFLPFNLRPGRAAAVFMGDAGSQVLGFSLAVLGLASSWTTAGTTIATMLLPLLVLAVPILDTTLVTVRRLLERRPVTQGGKDHTSHRLVYYGLSETRAVALLSLIAVVLGATAVAYNVLDRPAVTAVGVLLTFVLLVQFGGFLGELSERTRHGQPGDTSLRHALTVEPRRLAEVLADFALTCVAFLGAYLLVVGGTGSEPQRGTFLAALPIVLGTRYVGFVAFRVYRRVWRFATARDALALVTAVFAAELVALGILAATRDLGEFPARVLVVDAFLFAALATGLRLALRMLPELEGLRGGRRRLLVVGAGRAGRGIARAMREDGARVVGFVDDNPRLRGRRLQGIPVLGTLADVERVLATAAPEEVVLAIPDAPRERLDAVTDACRAAGVACRVVRIQADEAVLAGAASE